MTAKAKVWMENDRIHSGERFSFTLQRTLRLPEDGRRYPLPPGFGPFRLFAVETLGEFAPSAWKEMGGFVAPIYPYEALWLQFSAARWKPNAVRVSVGGIDAISGDQWSEQLAADPPNYIVCPTQPWLDGINAGEGMVRQFVAAEVGNGDTIAEQLGGFAKSALQVRVYDPKPGRFPESEPPHPRREMATLSAPGSSMGLGAGGAMRQKIYPDPYGLETWQTEPVGTIHIFLISPAAFSAATGEPPPSTPISMEAYNAAGLPWFKLSDEQQLYIAPSPALSKVKTLGQHKKEAEAKRDERKEN